MTSGGHGGDGPTTRGAILLAVLLLAGIAVAGARWLAPTAPPARRTDPSIAHRVDLNRAGRPEIAALPGIGETLADRIVSDRDRNGPFVDLADLARVHGIGPRTLERIRHHVRCGEPTP